MFRKILSHTFKDEPKKPEDTTSDKQNSEEIPYEELPKSTFTPFRPSASQIDDQESEMDLPTKDEKDLVEIKDLQQELEALLSRMDKVDPVQLLKDKTELENASLNADLALFDQDKSSEGEDDDDSDNSEEEDSSNNFKNKEKLL